MEFISSSQIKCRKSGLFKTNYYVREQQFWLKNYYVQFKQFQLVDSVLFGQVRLAVFKALSIYF